MKVSYEMHAVNSSSLYDKLASENCGLQNETNTRNMIVKCIGHCHDGNRDGIIVHCNRKLNRQYRLSEQELESLWKM